MSLDLTISTWQATGFATASILVVLSRLSWGDCRHHKQSVNAEMKWLFPYEVGLVALLLDQNSIDREPASRMNERRLRGTIGWSGWLHQGLSFSSSVTLRLVGAYVVLPLVSYGLEALKAMYRTGYRYKKVGVQIGKITPNVA